MAETGTMDNERTTDEPRPDIGRRLREQTTAVKDDVLELGRLTKQASREGLEHARQAASGYLDTGRHKATELEDTVVAYVREKPVKSLLIAAGAGAVLGFLLSRR